MPKLYFRYGAMSSSKTANLLMVAHNYEVQNKEVLLIKPDLDDRFGKDLIKSRCGLERKANIIVNSEDNLLNNSVDYSYYDCVLVDEVQFLTSKQIDQLRVITITTPVICYGIRTSYNCELFPGSKRLFELADTIEEVKTTCNFCNKKATINAKLQDGKVIKDGSNVIDIGGDEKYLSTCWFCWNNK
uniref:thymidine kinase n=1 Tax=viral metagenome TaxID=1070528 RepID=A0A6C0D273_9ZZZZ